MRKIETGHHVIVEGSLRHRFDTRIFVAARTVRLLDYSDENQSGPEATRCGVGRGDILA